MRVTGVFCRYLLLWYHLPVQAGPSGWKCYRCGLPGITQGELLGADDQIDYWRLSEGSRKQLTARPSQWSDPFPIAHPGASSVVRRGVFTKVAV